MNPGVVICRPGGTHAVVDEGEDAFLFLVGWQWSVHARERFGAGGEVEFRRGVGERGGGFFKVFVEGVLPMRTFDGEDTGASDGVVEEGGDQALLQQRDVALAGSNFRFSIFDFRLQRGKRRRWNLTFQVRLDFVAPYELFATRIEV